jgi:hypothetical protein
MYVLISSKGLHAARIDPGSLYSESSQRLTYPEWQIAIGKPWHGECYDARTLYSSKVEAMTP